MFFSEKFNVGSELIETYGAVDISLICDVPLFVDPMLIFNSNKPEYKALHEEIIKFFHFLYKKAEKGLTKKEIGAWFNFKEVPNNWLGYSLEGNKGLALGQKYAEFLYNNIAFAINTNGLTQSGHIEKIMLLYEGSGKDRIIISYPDNLGGGKCGGCSVIPYFRGLECSRTYRIIRDSDIVEQTKNVQYFVELCRNSKCYSTYQKIVKEGYRDDLPERDMIHIAVRDGEYIAEEGKHRICAMKRHEYNEKVYARVTYSENFSIKDYYLLVDYSPSERDLKEYYKCFEEYGIDRNEVLEYLSDQSIHLCKMIAEKNKLNEI